MFYEADLARRRVTACEPMRFDAGWFPFTWLTAVRNVRRSAPGSRLAVGAVLVYAAGEVQERALAAVLAGSAVFPVCMATVLWGGVTRGDRPLGVFPLFDPHAPPRAGAMAEADRGLEVSTQAAE